MRADAPAGFSQLSVFRSILLQSLLPFVPTYRISTVVFFATSRWISRFQFWVYGEVCLYVVIPRVRSVVGTVKGAVADVPLALGIGNVKFERVVYVDGLNVWPLPPEMMLIPGTVPMTPSTVMKLRSAPE